MTDEIMLEMELRESLGERAGAPVDTGALTMTAVRRGRRMRTRAYTVRGLTGVALAGVAALTLLPGSGPGQLSAGPPSGSPSPGYVSVRHSFAAPLGGGAPVDGPVPALPVARGVATGAAAVGTDPALLHFTVEGWPDRAALAVWSTGDGVESLHVVRTDETEYTIGLAHDEAALDELRQGWSGPDWTRGHGEPVRVGERPGELIVTAGEFSLRWAPVEGLWAQVYGTLQHADPQAALDLGARVRLGTAYRCGSPLHVGWLPPGVGVQGCMLTLTGYDIPDSLNQPTRVLQSQITVGDGSFQAQIQLRSAYMQSTVPDLPPPSGEVTRFYTTVAARAVVLTAGNIDTVQLSSIAQGLTLVGDGRDPGSWPERLAG